MVFHNKGQGATEYLVLLAVVLIIALVSIALLGFFPGLASDAKITQSSSYWRSASPFALLEHSVTTAGVATVVLQNVDATGSLTLTNLTFDNATAYTTSTTFASGEIKNLTLTNATTGTAGSLYDVQMNITYTSPNGLTATQYGSKTVVGKYR